MLKKTLAPVVIVVLFWFTMSSTTTYYLVWLERSLQRLFAENIALIRAADSLQVLVWRVTAEYPTTTEEIGGSRQRWKDTPGKIDLERRKLVESAFIEDEQRLLANLNSSVSKFLELMNRCQARADDTSFGGIDSAVLLVERGRVMELAGQIANLADELIRINQELAERDAQRRQRIGPIVFAGRLTMLVLGPLVGMLLGWRLATQLHRSIARIAVTLNDAHSHIESDVGTIAIESTSDFQDIQQQAEQVVQRMRQVSRELQIARREVLQSERLAAVGELAAGVAHEIRNPLTSVKLLLQHAIRQVSGPHLDESKLQLMLEEIGRMESTIQGLLDFSRPPKLNRTPHDLRQTLRRALNLIESRARQQQVEITTQMVDTPMIVDGDSEKLHQIMVNLLINSLEAMPNGGHLTITASKVMRTSSVKTDLASVASAKNSADCDAQVVFRDTGEGIATELLPRLFEPFATTKERGTGLGLAVSHRIAEEHAGTIHACNNSDGGAQFTLRLPIA